MPTHQRTPKPVTAVQWVKGTTTIEAVRAIIPDAFLVNGDLILPNAYDSGATTTQVKDGYWVMVLGDGPSEQWQITPPQVFATEYETYVAP